MRISLIGAGNLATQLGPALAAKGHSFLQVYSRTADSAEQLADKLNAQAVTQPEQIHSDVDLIICALKEDAFSTVLSRIDYGNAILVHTAGSLPMEELAEYTPNHGVLYPLQTFSKQRKVDFAEIPFFIEAANPEILKVLERLALDVSETVIPADSNQRKYLHLSAVFACNFVNYLYGVAENLVQEQGLDFQYLIPLITETAAKVKSLSPLEAQTGPAVRYNRTIMEKQLTLLKEHPDWQILYQKLSEGIHDRAITFNR